jgi:putative phosphoesterase
MRVAALYDIHGNLPALEAVLADARAARVEFIVIGGDVVPGPMPRETLELLLSLDIPAWYIRGNGEAAVLEEMAGREATAVPERFRANVRWVAAQLETRHQRAMSAWPATLRIEIAGLGAVLFCHATPRSDSEIFTRVTDESRVRPAFDGVDADIVVCGHTHMQFDRRVGGARVLNAGSVGMPFGEPGAYWLQLGPAVTLRRTSYDLDDAAARVRAGAYPEAYEFAEGNILHPPSEREVMERFAGAEMGSYNSPGSRAGSART